MRHTGRAVFIGEEADRSVGGSCLMDFQKAWKSNPVRSWSGGYKLADMAGSAANKVVLSKLSTLLASEARAGHRRAISALRATTAARRERHLSVIIPPKSPTAGLAAQEPFLVAFAERLWDALCEHPAGREAAARHTAYLRANGFESKASDQERPPDPTAAAGGLQAPAAAGGRQLPGTRLRPTPDRPRPLMPLESRSCRCAPPPPPRRRDRPSGGLGGTPTASTLIFRRRRTSTRRT